MTKKVLRKTIQKTTDSVMRLRGIAATLLNLIKALKMADCLKGRFSKRSLS